MAGSRIRIIFFTIAALISLAGLAEATYLTVQFLTGETLVCGGSADCFKVLGSAYARIAGIPVAAFGALGYFSAFSFATSTFTVTVRFVRSKLPASAGPFAVYVIDPSLFRVAMP